MPKLSVVGLSRNNGDKFMPQSFEESSLWKSTLGTRKAKDKYQGPRQALRQAYLDLRERAKDVAAQIHRDLPEFTPHDVTHLDALWSLSDRICGPNVQLTPYEGFILGGTFQVHDLAMALVCYPKGIEDLRKEDSWKDVISQCLAKQLERPATEEEIEQPDINAEEAAKSILLRELHAKQAQAICTRGWIATQGTPIFLIDKPELRAAVGGIIGLLAASHGWSLDDVRRQFEKPEVVGPPANIPSEWTLDRIKIACLLRAADAAHLDASRAPLFLRALVQPTGSSAGHWNFQGKVNQPTVHNNRLGFTSDVPGFTYPEASDWWLCLDTLRMVDDQLRQIDDLLVALKRDYRFEARGVDGVGSLEDFSRRVPTDGWEPVDTKVHVTDVAGLVCSLGGQQLYGNDRYVPLRELIQNGCDAVRARRLLQGRPHNWGKVTVRIGRDAEGPWVEVEDEGIGMSTAVLKGPLLDFGVSFWRSPAVRDELPGLLGKGFVSVGKYGIGFFSVFMWGNRVRVTTQRYDKGQEETRVLTFDAGVQSRPVLRKAEKRELIQGGGTRVRIWCKKEIALGTYNLETSAEGWARRLAWLCPALDVTLECVYENAPSQIAVNASDWIDMDGESLLKRLAEYEASVAGMGIREPGKKLRVMKTASGQPVGRAVLVPEGDQSRSETQPGVVVVGGMRTAQADCLAGVLVGSSTAASRNHAIPILPLNELGRWATEQIGFFKSDLGIPGEDRLHRLGAVIAAGAALGADIGDFPIANSKNLGLTFQDIHLKSDLPDQVVIVDSDYAYAMEGNPEAIKSMVFFADTTFRSVVRGEGPRDVWPPLPLAQPEGKGRLFRTPAGRLIEAIAQSWKASVDDVLMASAFDSDAGRFNQDSSDPLFAKLPEWQRSSIGEKAFFIRKPGSKYGARHPGS